jgi:hypothetical protein
MSPLSVDRISVQAPGLSPGEGRRLARLLAEGLGAAVPTGARPASVPSMSVRSATAAAPVDELAQRVLADLAAELRRHL